MKKGKGKRELSKREAKKLPKRQDGKKSKENVGGSGWGRNHIRCAQMRADGIAWDDIAETIGITAASCRNYANIKGWKELTNFFFAQREDSFAISPLDPEKKKLLKRQKLSAATELAVSKLYDMMSGISITATGEALLISPETQLKAIQVFLDSTGWKRRMNVAAEIEAKKDAGIDVSEPKQVTLVDIQKIMLGAYGRVEKDKTELSEVIQLTAGKDFILVPDNVDSDTKEDTNGKDKSNGSSEPGST